MLIEYLFAGELKGIGIELEKVMAHFYVYADESGKLANSDIISFCGYVSHVSECERAMLEWDNCRLGWGVPPLHMRCVMYPERDKTGEWLKINSEWGNLWEEKRKLMLNDFSSIVLNSQMACVGAVLDANHFRSMPENKWKVAMKDPVFLGFYSLLMDALDKVDRISTSLSVGVIVDDDPEHAKEYYDLLNALKASFPRVRERVSAITFGNDREYPALQMADMIAYESRSLMVQRMHDPEARHSDIFARLTKRGIHQPKMWTANFLDEASKIGTKDDKTQGG